MNGCHLSSFSVQFNLERPAKGCGVLTHGGLNRYILHWEPSSSKSKRSPTHWSWGSCGWGAANSSTQGGECSHHHAWASLTGHEFPVAPDSQPSAPLHPSTVEGHQIHWNRCFAHTVALQPAFLRGAHGPGGQGQTGPAATTDVRELVQGEELLAGRIVNTFVSTARNGRPNPTLCAFSGGWMAC